MNLKISLAQIESKPNLLKHNKNKILRLINLAKEQKQDLIIFPELALTGYLCMDLFLNQNFLEAQNQVLYEVIKQSKNITIILGFVDFFVLNKENKELYFSDLKQKNIKKTETQNGQNQKVSQNQDNLDLESIKKESGLLAFNSAIIIRNQKIIKIVHKTNLPNYDIFSEKRYFRSASEFNFQKLWTNQNFQNQHLLQSLKYSPLQIKKIYSKNSVYLKKIQLGVMICEDMWDENYFYKPAKNLNLKPNGIFINISHSPFWINKDKERSEAIKKVVLKTHKPLIFVNGVGAFDGYNGQILFDGKSCVCNKKAELVLQAKEFKEDLANFEIYSEIDSKKEIQIRFKSDSNLIQNVSQADLKNVFDSSSIQNWQILQGLILGIKEYLKLGNFKNIFLGLSGGVDSALVLILSFLATKNQKDISLKPILMTSKWTSKESVLLSQELAKNLDLELGEVSIENLLDLYKKEILISSKFKSDLNPISLENLQARIRANILMSLANNHQGIVLSTSNKTEVALGYTTLYGDMAGGLSPILDLDKLKVYELCNFINNNWKFLENWGFDLDLDSYSTPKQDLFKKQKSSLGDYKQIQIKLQADSNQITSKFKSNKNNFYQGIIPKQILTRKPTAELRNNQTDEESLGANYKVLVPLVNEIIENPSFCVQDFLAKIEEGVYQNLTKKDYLESFIKKIFEQIKRNEFKRRQSPPGIKITKKAFGIGRRQSFLDNFLED